MKFINHAEGYLEPAGGGIFRYVFQYKDHLENIRLSYSDTNGNGLIATTEIIEENNYYPFGLKHRGYNSAINGTEYKFKFNGKELQDELGLNWYDYQARNYDPAIGRWMSVDPLASEFPEWSPYTSMSDSPINFIDPAGMAAEDWYATSGGDLKYDKNINSQADLDNAGIDGTYIAESFLGADQNGQVFNFQSDGNVTYTPGATTSAYIAGGIPEDAFVNIESTPLGTKSGDSMAAAGAAVATPTSSNPFGAIINAAVGLTMLITAAVQISGNNDMRYSFSKVARGNQRDTGLQGVTDAEIARELNNLRGNLNKEQKAQKIRLQKEQKARGQRNKQKKNSEKGTGTGRQ